MSLSFRLRTAAAWLLLVGVTGCNQAPQSSAPAKKPPSQASLQWANISNGFIEDYLRAQPSFAAQAGRHEFDGQLPDLSSHGIKREISRLHDAREQITAVDPTPLEPRERFDREYLLSVIDKNLFWLEKARYPFSNPYWYIDNLDPDMYLSRNYAPLEVRMKAYIKYARGIPRMVTDIQANLQGPLPKTFVELGIADFGGFADFYTKNVAATFASVSDPDLQKQLADADSNAANAMNNLKNYLIGLRKTATDKFPLGKDMFADMVKATERVDVPVEQIEAAGRADLERNTQALKAECAVYLPKGTLAACVAKVSANKPQGGVLEAARVQLVELKKFIQDNNVVSIPGNDEALVAEAPAYNRSNAGFIEVPGPYDHGVASTYNIVPPDPKWSKAEQSAYIPSQSSLLFGSAHEVWPGHFLQFLHSNANPSKLEGLWVGYGFAEGWAHYGEEMMYERGLGKGDPEKHIGQLIEALYRDVRLLSAIGMHTEGMTVAQSEKMFSSQAFQDPGNARQQAARGTYDPGYLNYTLGKLMIRKLRADWVAKSAGGAPPAAGASPSPDDQAHWKDFHDKFLSYGGPPIPLLRKEMMGETGSLL
ncbi:MAG TPA: DUF885 domain-containing protein [Steroidobacteraceae bacterium]|nr:DUF885 domain-containing protein [Steroidobacteraceae bacterium]